MFTPSPGPCGHRDSFPWGCDRAWRGRRHGRRRCARGHTPLCQLYAGGGVRPETPQEALQQTGGAKGMARAQAHRRRQGQTGPQAQTRFAGRLGEPAAPRAAEARRAGCPGQQTQGATGTEGARQAPLKEKAQKRRPCARCRETRQRRWRRPGRLEFRERREPKVASRKDDKKADDDDVRPNWNEERKPDRK